MHYAVCQRLGAPALQSIHWRPLKAFEEYTDPHNGHDRSAPNQKLFQWPFGRDVLTPGKATGRDGGIQQYSEGKCRCVLEPILLA